MLYYLPMIYDKRNRDERMYLHPVVAKAASLLLDRLEEIGEEVLIVDGMRTSEEQDALYKKVPRVTHVHDSNSYHVHGMAIDIVPVGLFGRLCWNDNKRYEIIAREAKILGFDWGYEMWCFDRPHFQFTQGLTIEQLKNGAELRVQEFNHLSREEVLQSRARRLRRALNRCTGIAFLTLQGELRRLLGRL